MKQAKRTKRIEHSARIGTHFLSALLYADESGLSREDKEQLTDWLSQVYGSIDVCIDLNIETIEDDEGNETEVTSDQEPFFGRCQICKLQADVMDVTVIETVKA